MKNYTVWCLTITNDKKKLCNRKEKTIIDFIN